MSSQSVRVCSDMIGHQLRPVHIRESCEAKRNMSTTQSVCSCAAAGSVATWRRLHMTVQLSSASGHTQSVSSGYSQMPSSSYCTADCCHASHALADTAAGSTCTLPLLLLLSTADQSANAASSSDGGETKISNTP